MNVRYRRLGYVALDVTDLERSSAFYREMVGLAAAGEGAAGQCLFRCSDKHHDLVLTQGAVPGLRRIAFEMASADDLVALRGHLVSLGLTVRDVADVECVALGIARAFRFSLPHSGATLECFHGMTTVATPYEPTVTKIARLGHAVIATDEHAACERFVRDELNFRVSDRIDGAVTFMRCFPNPLHHSFGISKGTSKHMHHVNFMVTDIDDIGRALYRAQARDVPVVFGPGRHPPSESIFLYFLDPDELTVEYSFGMEEFPEEGPREPRLLPFSLESIDYWGARPEPRFAKQGALAALED